MNEFLEQFLLESRELVEQTTADLLALEGSPHDRDRLDSAFRGFHTLKGAARIVEFDSMGRVLHAAEELLVAVRAGEHPVTADLISDCLTCIDHVVQWLDAIESSGDLPDVPAATVDGLLRRFAKGAQASGNRAPDAAPGWADRLAAAHPEARVAVRYVPDPGCFFRGEDPLRLVAELPGLVGLDVAPSPSLPDLAAIDPFACHLVVVALSSASADAVAASLAIVADQIELKTLAASQSSLSDEAQALLREQVLLVADRDPATFIGRFASAGHVATQVLQAEGRAADASAIARAVAAGDVEAMAAAIQTVLHGGGDAETTRATQDVTARALRVEVERIDALVKLTSELTVMNNAVGHTTQLAQDGADAAQLAPLLKDQHARLARLVGELQRAVLGIRVLPLRHVFQRFPKLVREMGASLDKNVRLVTEGETTEADKAIVEALFEPLLHVLRNAIDHGIEPASVRAAANKPPVATVHLRAMRDGDHVVVEVQDDGAGIDPAAIRRVAAARGVADAAALDAMSDTEARDLIFAPGFSTAAAVTDISGRGVGMDAVRNAVTRLGGTVTVASETGAGTTVRFLLPFTLMMSRVMTVEAGGQMFGIPFEAIVETVRVPRAEVVGVGAAEAFVLRDCTVPVIDLAAALDLRGPTARPAIANLVVTMAGGQLGAIEVDRFGDRLDVMLKSMDGLLAGAHGVAGTTLLGDGRVLIVLDVPELLR